MTIPTYITMTRIALIPWIIVLLFRTAWIPASILLICAIITDYVDGALARYLNQESHLGAILDHLADKLLLISCAITLIIMNTSSLIFPRWFLLLIVVREGAIFAGSAILYISGKMPYITPIFSGKVALTSQLVCITIACCQLAMDNQFSPVLMSITMGIAIWCMLYSGIYYIKKGITQWYTTP